jgi:amino acid adenylation domain-containing protein/FkbM family methyltransferase
MQQQITEGFRLSPQQKHLWLMQSVLGSSSRNARCVVLIEGEFYESLLQSAVETVVRRHEVLRTVFHCLPGMSVPLQVITDGHAEWTSENDLSELDWPGQQAELEKLLDYDAGSSADAEQQSLRLSLFILSANRRALVIRQPALGADEASLDNLVREISETYATCATYAAAGTRNEGEDEPMQYVVASEWLNSLLNSDEATAGIKFWRQKDYTALHDLRLPYEKDAAFSPSFVPEFVRRTIDAGLSKEIEELSERYDSSVEILLLAVWQILLRRLSGRENVLTGVAFDGRTDEELERALGLFARFLPIHSRLDENASGGSVLAQLNEAMLEASEWQECFTWEAIAASVHEVRERRFFPYSFSFVPEAGRYIAGGVTFAIHERLVCLDRFKLQLSCTMKNGSLVTDFHYDTSLFGAEEIARLAGQFQKLIESVVRYPEAPISQLDILSELERQQLLVDFNRTEADYSEEKLLHKLFEAQTERTPARVAVEFEGESLTYEELNARANRVAHYLRRHGVGPESAVSLLMERSMEMLVGLLGVLKAGGAYVPLNASLPLERLAFMSEDANTRVFVTVEALRQNLPDSAETIICLDGDNEAISAESDNPEGGATPDNLAYVIYTSGSTGRPKGVMISHRSIANRLLWMQATYPLTPDDRLLQKTVFNFDASVWEFFVPLMSGATLVMARPGGHQDSAYLVQTIAEQRITTLQVVPSMLEVLLDEAGFAECESLRRVFCGGEALTLRAQERFYQTLGSARLHNLYGPTEVSIDASYSDCERGQDYGVTQGVVPIGRPLANVQVYLLDEYLNPVPWGVTGELHVGGVGLARGYLNRPELTAEKFIPDPFSTQKGARLYRTGDLARHLPSGALEFLGRRDHQVKLRGFRIELGEIEAVLRHHPAVKDAVALAREDQPGNQQLVAYVVPAQRNGHALAQPARELYRLPNNLEIAQLNKNETDLLYKEIFEDEGYLKHGITLEDDYCVFDVGANIGLFTLFVHTKCRGARVFSFEPSPPTFEVLKANVELHHLDVKPYQCAISSKAGTAEFTFYPKVSASSGLYANVEEDAGVTRAFIGNQSGLGAYADELLEGRFEAVRYNCQLRTLSEVMREQGVDRIDLLKVDVEKSELDVLEGIAEEDWGKIKQVVLEVHDTGGRLAAITDLLRRHGFEFVVEQYLAFEHTGLYNVFAVHPSRFDAPAKARHKTEANGRLHSDSAPALTTHELRQYLFDKLPDYMVPSTVVVLDELPLTSSGKVDRRALPAPQSLSDDSGRSMIAPRTPIEELLAGLWANLLGVEQIGIRDNFFDLGGHSLLATQVISRLREAFKVEVPLRSIFETPTVEHLAKVLQSMLTDKSSVDIPPVRPAGRDRHLPLSFAQQRLWFLDQLQPGNFFFNMPVAFRLTGRLDAALLERAVNEVIKRHESLRTTFSEVEGQPIQVIAPGLRLTVEFVDLSHLPQAERDTETSRLATREAQRPFDLQHGPLLRAALLRTGAEEHVALFTMHHIVSDGWSMGVLVQEVTQAYAALSRGEEPRLGDLAVQYADYAVWQREWLNGDVLENQLSYWREQLGGELAALDLPTDRTRPAVQTYRGARQAVKLSPALTATLKGLGRQEGATLFMTLLAAFQVLLYSYSKQEEIVVGTDVANRNQLEIEPLIGFFINQLVLRTDLSGDPSFRELLSRVRAVTLGAYAHQDLPFDKLVDALKPERDTSRSPLFQVKLVLQNVPFESLELPGLTLSPVEFEGGKANLDLTLFMGESAEGMSGVMEYNTDLFDASTVQLLLARFELLLTRIVAQPAARLSELKEMVDHAERDRVEAEKKKISEASFKKFKNVKPKTVQLKSPEELVKLESVNSESELPLVIEPNADNVELVEWAQGNRQFIEAKLWKHGALLFRNFPLELPSGFEHFAGALCSELFNENGEHPRRSLGGNVYTPVFYPAEQLLLWHNENSFNHRWPGKIWFCCAQPAQQGGETPIVDSRRVFEQLDARLREQFIEKGIMYVRNYGDGIGRDWQAVFQTDNPAEAEARCAAAKMELEWKGNGRARTRCVRPAVVQHPQTHEMSWFNQAQHWHISCLDPITRESIEAIYAKEDYPRNCYYGDGSQIEDSVMAEILEVYKQLEVVFPWRAGDILMLDNVLTAHARRPFDGERKLLVAMGDMLSFDDVKTATRDEVRSLPTVA